MNVIIRLPRSLLRQVLADLARPHPFAFERVGFLYGRFSSADARQILLMTAYTTLADDRYIRDPTVGARIDSQAIRLAMQGVLDRKEGVFHTHVHDYPGRPEFSPIDRKEMPKLVPGFQAAGQLYAHGLLLLSPNSAMADVWLPRRTSPTRASQITVVGFPLEII